MTILWLAILFLGLHITATWWARKEPLALKAFVTGCMLLRMFVAATFVHIGALKFGIAGSFYEAVLYGISVAWMLTGRHAALLTVRATAHCSAVVYGSLVCLSAIDVVHTFSEDTLRIAGVQFFIFWVSGPILIMALEKFKAVSPLILVPVVISLLQGADTLAFYGCMFLINVAVNEPLTVGFSSWFVKSVEAFCAVPLLFWLKTGKRHPLPTK